MSEAGMKVFCPACSGSGGGDPSRLMDTCLRCKGTGTVPNEYKRDKEAEAGPTKPWGDMKKDETQSRIDWPAYLPKGFVDPLTGNLAGLERSKEIYENMIPKPDSSNPAGIATQWTPKPTEPKPTGDAYWRGPPKPNYPSIDVSKGALGPAANHVSIDVFNDAPDPVRRPSATPKPAYDDKGNASHYQGEIECIDAIRVQLGDDGFTAFLRGTIARYVWRLGQKDASHLEAVKVGWYSRALENHLKRLSK